MQGIQHDTSQKTSQYIQVSNFQRSLVGKNRRNNTHSLKLYRKSLEKNIYYFISGDVMGNEFLQLFGGFPIVF